MGAKGACAAIAVLSLGWMTGCGGGGGGGDSAAPEKAASTTPAAATTTSAPNMDELAQTYLRIVKPANQASEALRKKASHWTDSTTPAQAAKDAEPTIAAYRAADNALLRVDWPAATRWDVKELVRADSALIGDLEALEGLDAFSTGNWSSQFVQDAEKVGAAANIVRADLGLPPYKG
jgi:hypothetical protein